MEIMKSEISAYNILTLAALAVSLVVIYFLARRKNLLHLDLFYAMAGTAIGVFLGAHIMFLIVSLPDFITSLAAQPPADVGDFLLKLYYASSGLVYYGGLLGGILALYISLRSRRLPMRTYMNLIVVVFPLFHGIGRIGCVLTGCCYGIEYHGPLAITYPDSVVTEGLNDHITDFSRFPVQPLEAVLEIILFVILLVLYLKKDDKISILIPYLLSYAVIRFLDEFLRGDEIRGIWGPFSTSQWIALIVIIVTIIYLIFKKQKHPPQMEFATREL